MPVKLFVLNNDGYISIKQTQDSFFAGHRVACDPATCVSFPEIVKVAAAYGLPAMTIDSHKGMDEKIKTILNTRGPVVCDVKLTCDYIFSPKVSSKKMPDGRMVSRPLEDMYPFLSKEELKENMIVPLLDDK